MVFCHGGGPLFLIYAISSSRHYVQIIVLLPHYFCFIPSLRLRTSLSSYFVIKLYGTLLHHHKQQNIATALNVDIKIQVGEGEPIESALRRFKLEVNKSCHLQELRYKRYFENSQDLKKRKIVQARFRQRMERMQARRMRQQRT